MARKRRRNIITGRHFEEKPPDAIITEPLSSYPIPENRSYSGRLSWIGDWAKHDLNYNDLASTIEYSALQHALFFIDTGVFSTNAPDVFWKALLRKKIIVTPRIREELEPWLQNPHGNAWVRDIIVNAIKNCSLHVYFDTVDDKMKNHGYEYYARLLLLRKLKGHQFATEFLEKNGRPPSEEEFTCFIQKRFGERGRQLAWKGWNDFGKPNYAADEQFVVMAVLSAILSGNEVVIITRDTDVPEQFYKLIYLLDTHYRGMLFADVYSASAAKFKSVSINHFLGLRSALYCGSEDCLVDPQFKSPQKWQELLPQNYTHVPIECWLLGGDRDHPTICRTAFGAETEFAQILRIKSFSDGKNTDKLGEYNCHIRPFPGYEMYGPWVGVVKDRRVNYANYCYNKLDMMDACNSKERWTLTIQSHDFSSLNYLPNDRDLLNKFRNRE